MNIKITTVEGTPVAALVSDNVEIRNAQDALELLMNAQYQGAEAVAVEEKHLIPGFFDLKTGIAGDILQKFSTYDGRLIIVGNFGQVESKSLRDFIYESNKTGRIVFSSSVAEGAKKLSSPSA